MAIIEPTHRPDLFRAAVAHAAELLRAGEVVALPTETVYGLAANALNPDAVAAIFSVKRRPTHNPIIVHVASLAMAHQITAQWPSMARKLAQAFWPGPLTLVLPKAAQVPALVTAGGETVGVRWPSHPVMQAVIELCGFPLAAPSANLSSQVSPTTAEHVQRALGDRVPLIVDGGPAAIGIESTVLDITRSPARILRPGMIHAESLAAVIGEVRAGPGGSEGALRSPGLLLKHYSPRAKLALWSGSDSQLTELAQKSGQVHLLTRTRVPTGLAFARLAVMPREPGPFARALYSELHQSDVAGAELIVVEAPPEAAEWHGIADRLRRAAA
jgi:L-threonylcarbamoyladenylate synthase